MTRTCRQAHADDGAFSLIFLGGDVGFLDTLLMFTWLEDWGCTRYDSASALRFC